MIVEKFACRKPVGFVTRATGGKTPNYGPPPAAKSDGTLLLLADLLEQMAA